MPERKNKNDKNNKNLKNQKKEDSFNQKEKICL